MGYEDRKYDCVELEKKDGILCITLNEPESLNALRLEMIEELVIILRQAIVDPEVRVLVLTGSGRGFSAGGNVKAMVDPATGGKAHPLQRPPFNVGVLPPSERMSKEFVTGLKLMKTLWEFWKPTIAAINGLATGAGMDMAMVCDIRIASESAKMSQAYINIGLMPYDGGMYHLPRMVGLGKAYELMYTGDFIDANEALKIGILNKVTKDGELMAEAMNFAAKIASKPPVSVQMMKHLTQQALTMQFSEAMDFFYSCYDILLKTDDHREGVLAILEKRKALFKGK